MEKFVFLDRDGVINRDPAWVGRDYVTDWTEFEFLPGALEAIKELTEKGYRIAVISNQAGVSKGIYPKEKLEDITQKMLKEIEASGGKIYSVNYCVHKDEDNCGCRKPKTGLFKKATDGLKVDFSRSYFIGDAKRDIEAGKHLGSRTILVLSGKTKTEKETEDWVMRPDFIKRDLKEAAAVVLCDC